MKASARQRSPSWLLWVAGVAVGLSVVALGGGLALHLVGYALASLFAFTAIALFRRRSLELSATAGIGVSSFARVFAGTTLLVGFVVSVADAWFVASHLS